MVFRVFLRSFPAGCESPGCKRVQGLRGLTLSLGVTSTLALGIGESCSYCFNCSCSCSQCVGSRRSLDCYSHREKQRHREE